MVTHPIAEILAEVTEVSCEACNLLARRVPYRFDSPQQHPITDDTQEQNQGRGDEGRGERVCGGNDVASNNGCGNGRELAGQVGNAGKRAYAVVRRDKRRNGPGHGSRGSQAAQGETDPDESCGGAAGMSGAENR